MDPNYFINERRRDAIDLILGILAATAIAVVVLALVVLL